MPTRNVVFTDHQQGVIEALVQSGRYQNASEVVRDGVRLIEQREAQDAAKLEALRRASELGWRDVEAGLYLDVANDELDDLVARLGDLAGRQAGPQD